MQRPVLSAEEFRLWAEWLSEEYGLHWIPERREILRTRLEPRRAALGLDSFDQLLFHLRFNPGRQAERERLVPHLTNNESYFCREQGSLNVIRDEIIPALARQAGPGGEVRMLSAACSRGEEAYTLSTLALDAGIANRVRVTGMDVDGDALAAAEAGVYGEHAFRGGDPAWRDRHFIPLGEDRWRVKPALRQPVRFVRDNLVRQGWWEALPPQHLILCRNVMIYFDPQGIRRAAEGLYNALAPGGSLFLGHAESLRQVPVPLKLERRPGALFYRRVEEA